jgi:hypothetical protein
MAVILSDDINVKAKRRWRANPRKAFHYRRNLAIPLSPEAEDRLGLDENSYVSEEIEGNHIVLTFYRRSGFQT